MNVPAELRARIAADYTAVTPMPSSLARALWVGPFALLSLLAAPTYFNVRSDALQLGWTLTWGASVLQAGLGFLLIVAALRESIPGRAWSSAALTAWVAVPTLAVMGLTLLSAETSLIPLRRGFWIVGAVCLGGSAATALPVVAIANVLAARAYPTRPGLMGMLVGLGGGLIADAGWRMFCHFGEPSHVLSAHGGGVVVAAIAGATLAVTLRKPFR